MVSLVQIWFEIWIRPNWISNQTNPMLSRSTNEPLSVPNRSELNRSKIQISPYFLWFTCLEICLQRDHCFHSKSKCHSLQGAGRKYFFFTKVAAVFFLENKLLSWPKLESWWTQNTISWTFMLALCIWIERRIIGRSGQSLGRFAQVCITTCSEQAWTEQKGSHMV